MEALPEVESRWGGKAVGAQPGKKQRSSNTISAFLLPNTCFAKDIYSIYGIPI
jgi:hypothetical protein